MFLANRTHISDVIATVTITGVITAKCITTINNIITITGINKIDDNNNKNYNKVLQDRIGRTARERRRLTCSGRQLYGVAAAAAAVRWVRPT